ncbi:GNAT family N-acetyltransferase [Actinocorallia sp. API 0066]|uniref:GNAT family N-acetyltransferase n=1 Tax=Actinocorallia sp. API 0066 TaxID=2896846 RepID=UPI001E39D067|nr:GNAT family N-acetyltransferase [Actinocorallia sp. API 0066]MCD0451676.1 GNAT family N-acetyltransferase [Actinocorallia sp. API 0066]
MANVLRTERLMLRRWRDDDRAPFAELNADPEVMAHFPTPLTRAQSDELIELIESRFTRSGFGLWALEVAATGEFIGFTGLSLPRFTAHFTPTVEIGWRLSRTAWGHGYATEAAQRALSFGFNDPALREIVAMTTTTNTRSQAVMRRLGMTHNPSDDFDHPLVPPGPLKRHVLWRLTAQQWTTTPHPGDLPHHQP